MGWEFWDVRDSNRSLPITTISPESKEGRRMGVYRALSVDSGGAIWEDERERAEHSLSDVDFTVDDFGKVLRSTLFHSRS